MRASTPHGRTNRPLPNRQPGPAVGAVGRRVGWARADRSAPFLTPPPRMLLGLPVHTGQKLEAAEQHGVFRHW